MASFVAVRKIGKKYGVTAAARGLGGSVGVFVVLRWRHRCVFGSSVVLPWGVGGSARGSGWRYRLLVALVVLRWRYRCFFGCLVVLLVVLEVLLVLVANKKKRRQRQPTALCSYFVPCALQFQPSDFTSCEHTICISNESFFWDSTVRIGRFSCDDVSVEWCLYTLRRAHKQETKNAASIGTILERPRARSSPQLFRTHDVLLKTSWENGAQAIQLQTRITWKKKKEKRARIRSPDQVTKTRRCRRKQHPHRGVAW